MPRGDVIGTLVEYNFGVIVQVEDSYGMLATKGEAVIFVRCHASIGSGKLSSGLDELSHLLSHNPQRMQYQLGTCRAELPKA